MMGMTTGDDAAQRKARGAFFTPAPVARFLFDWAVRSPGDDVLEPSCGEAVFLHQARPGHTGRLTGVELHTGSARRAQRSFDARLVNLLDSVAGVAALMLSVKPTLTPDQVEAMLLRRCLDLIGLARRAGELVAGFDQVAEALSKSRSHIANLLRLLNLPDEVRDALAAFVDEHYKPEPKQRRRPASFRAPGQR